MAGQDNDVSEASDTTQPYQPPAPVAAKSGALGKILVIGAILGLAGGGIAFGLWSKVEQSTLNFDDMGRWEVEDPSPVQVETLEAPEISLSTIATDEVLP